MSTRREGLRPLTPKAPKQTKTNAQKCREYKMRLKADPDRYKEMLEKNKLCAKRWRDNCSELERQRLSENARLRQQKRREKLKLQTAVHQPKNKKSLPKTSTTTRAQQRLEEEKLAKKRENARLRQAKRRALIKKNPQTYRRYRESRQRQRLAKKLETSVLSSPAPPRKFKLSLYGLLNKVKDALKYRRSKHSLLHFNFLKKLLIKQNPVLSAARSYYKRHFQLSLAVERHYDKHSVHLPYVKCGQKQKKVLTRRLLDVYLDFKKDYLLNKISFSTIKRRRPPHILLAASRKFIQCLCEKCQNFNLMLKTVNSYLVSRQILSVEDIVHRTLCPNFNRSCVDRCCESCGVDCLQLELKKQVAGHLRDQVTWKRWEKTDSSPKDCVGKTGPLRTLISTLCSEVHSLARHLKFAQWQRDQYQFLKDNLPPGHAILTVDFAENYVCKHQYEVQSAHWTYKQISVQPSVFFTDVPKVAVNIL